jgi:hypothetical protein
MYTLLAIGVHVHMHYCCGKLATIQFFEQKENCCNHDEDHHSGTAIEKNCCSNESLTINLNDEHEAFSWIPQITASTVAVLEHTYTKACSNLIKNFIPTQQAHAPPGKTPIYLSLQSLIYYA